jgi:PKD repeat protein
MAIVRVISLSLALGAFFSITSPGYCQYMFLDLDGDGAQTYSDDFTFGQGPDTIDLYLVIDPSTSTCTDGFDSYTVNLFVAGTPMVFKTVENMMPRMSESVPLQTYPYALTVGYSGAEAVGPGTFHLLHMTVEYLPSDLCPALTIVPSSCYSPPGVVTSIGATCPGVGEIPAYGSGFYGCTDMPPHKPLVSCPAEVQGREGEPMTFGATVTHPECGGYLFSYWSYGFPEGAAVSPLSGFHLGEATQTVTWTPAQGQAGEYSVTFEAQQPFPFNIFDQRRSTCVTRLVVQGGNAAPTANANGPYSGAAGVPVSFDGSASSDPEGEPLTLSWTFGDGQSAEGSTPQHTYGSHGNFTVILTAADPAGSSDVDTTTATIVTIHPATVFTSASDEIIRLSHGKPFSCFQMEPGTGGAFAAGDIDPSSLRFHVETPGCGIVTVVPASAKNASVRDTDRDGVDELGFCVTADTWMPLTSCLGPVESRVQVALSGSLGTPEQIISATFTQRFHNGNVPMSAAITPNPIGPSSTLRLSTTRQGFVSARLFDVQGRLVGVLLDHHSVPAGTHEIPLEGYQGFIGRVASGVYFVRVDAQHDGTETRVVTVVR